MSENAPRHPGRVLFEDYVYEAGVSLRTLAREMGVPVTRLSNLCREKNAMTADTAIKLAALPRLAKVFSRDPRYWLNLQMEHDLHHAWEKIEADQNSSAKRRSALGMT